MDARGAKLALARKKLKDHQEKRIQKGEVDQVSYQENNNTQSSPINAAELIGDDENSLGTGNSSFALGGKCDNMSMILTESDAKSAELLITNKVNLEIEVNELKQKLVQLKSNNDMILSNYNTVKNQNNYLETELGTLREKLIIISDQLTSKDKDLVECKENTSVMCEENNNLLEQLEFTKTVLATKETENIALHGKLSELQNNLDASMLRLQQLTNDTTTLDNPKNVHIDCTEPYIQKIAVLEQQLKFAQKEREQVNSHYEHYVSELNQQLKLACSRNEELTQQAHMLSARENSLIDQISSMEIQLQKLRNHQETQTNKNTHTKLNELEQKNNQLQECLHITQKQYNDIKQKLAEAEIQIKELENLQMPPPDLCISKLNADIANDKVAAQRATEQNKKLKSDLQELEGSFVKMSKDKLELTEKLDAEKFLNRELTVKLAEYVETAKDMQTKLSAKDNEMIRLLANYREVEGKLAELSRFTQSNEGDSENHVKGETKTLINDNVSTLVNCEETFTDSSKEMPNDNNCIIPTKVNDTCSHKTEHNIYEDTPNREAMHKLQERFLKIMDEVADLSDEKHRLEHIILQLQNETETICEYVALYQQQRSLLKQRDEDRSSQIKIFQIECERMKSQLNELNDIIVNLATDKELATYFLKESRQNDFAKVLNLLKNMKNNFLVNSGNHDTDMKNFYPCACCSGNLINL